MEYLLDTANLEEIKKYQEIVRITGVTSNPTILKREGKIDLFDHLRKIRKLIGNEKTLHVQVVSEDCEGMIQDAMTILEKVDSLVYIKIPTNEEGLKAMRQLKQKGVHITATAIYTIAQGLMAMEAGADFIAPYYNRMENLNIDPLEVIESLSKMIEKYHYPTKILAASFKNMNQVNNAFIKGAQTATMGVDVIAAALSHPSIDKAVKDFNQDFKSVYGQDALLQNF